jgi:hypothetical protein
LAITQSHCFDAIGFLPSKVSFGKKQDLNLLIYRGLLFLLGVTSGHPNHPHLFLKLKKIRRDGESDPASTPPVAQR